MFASKVRVLCTLIAVLVAASILAHSVQAGFDGFSILSSTFDNQYNGNEVWDGVTFQNQWVQAGGGDPSELTLNGTNLVVEQVANNGWFEHDDGATPFELGSGSWTVEVRAHVQATGASGFNIWAALNGERDILIVNEGSVTNLGGTEFDANDNTDGFHDFRLVYDATDDVYHYFRDAVQLTPAAGVGQQAASANTRLIIGDCCTGVAGIGSIVEYEYIRYDMDGAFSPAPDQGARTVTIDRDTGEISIQNTSGTNVSNIIGYSLLSSAAALDQANWDRQSDGPSQLAGDDDDWTVLTGAGVSNDLSEAVLTTSGAGDGGDLVASTGFWTFGNVWRRGPFEDVVVELLLDDGTILDSTSDLVVTYVGNNDEPFNFGDFDLDRDLDAADWAAFKGLYRGDRSGRNRGSRRTPVRTLRGRRSHRRRKLFAGRLCSFRSPAMTR